MTRITKKFKYDERYKDGREKNYKTQIRVFIVIILFCSGYFIYDYIKNSKSKAQSDAIHIKYHKKTDLENWFFTVNYCREEYKAKKIIDSLRKYDYSADIYFIPGNEYDEDIGELKESLFNKYVCVIGLFDSEIEAEEVRTKFLSDKRVWGNNKSGKGGWFWHMSSQLPGHDYEISPPLKVGSNVYKQKNCSYE